MTISAAALLAGRNLAGFFFPVNVTRYNSSVIRCTRKHSSFERWQKTLSSLFLIKNAKGHSDFAVVINAAADRFFFAIFRIMQRQKNARFPDTNTQYTIAWV